MLRKKRKSSYDESSFQQRSLASEQKVAERKRERERDLHFYSSHSVGGKRDAAGDGGGE